MGIGIQGTGIQGIEIPETELQTDGRKTVEEWVNAQIGPR